MQIKTERLLLRPFAEADAADLYKYAKARKSARLRAGRRTAV